jgi:hypothetical protein
MPVGVVDRLEAIEVDEQDPDIDAGAWPLRQDARDPGDQFVPVEQLRHGVVGGQEAQLIAGGSRFGDIDELGNVPAGSSALVTQ